MYGAAEGVFDLAGAVVIALIIIVGTIFEMPAYIASGFYNPDEWNRKYRR